MFDRFKAFLTALIAGFVLCADATADVRLKDIVNVEGVRGNDLVGYGLIVGLDGTGDGVRNSPYTEEALSSLLERLGVNVQGEDFRPRNVAAVVVTATLPPFARTGSQIDVTVSAIGDASNLLGGTLIMTPLHAADGNVYAVAQGPVLASGFSAEGAGAEVTFGAPTSGSIPQGARIEKEIKFDFASMESLRLALRSPDFTTATRIESAINGAFGQQIATVLDPGTIEVDMASAPMKPVHLLGRIENLRVSPEQKARIVIDQKSGTVVLGADVKISRFAVTQGNLTITVRETPVVSQPNPFSRNGETIVLPDTTISVDQQTERRIGMVEENVSLSDLIEGLNALGVGPRELIDILKSVKAAGALHAELVLM
ncbi:flagellar basal body P-ring protein FlgI [Hyphococcus flavus]|uniref:Flagellar P-ring protein n=1 Tax=Hyphococcus flavus TaxID=1866326 RepID=A0AAF0CFL1_9PROT|nr:flagellar basal body P-ring protein FlgI [Hyphococcus flavus]WDI31529.1 flagellar basal body P-ring protein FlgI [Hyphococcus flavus]